MGGPEVGSVSLQKQRPLSCGCEPRAGKVLPRPHSTHFRHLDSGFSVRSAGSDAPVCGFQHSNAGRTSTGLPWARGGQSSGCGWGGIKGPARD